MVITNVWAGTGRLSKDPKVRYAGSKNTCFADFSIAVRKRFHKDGESDADFFEVTTSGKTAEFCEKYLKKGVKIEIHGHLTQNVWTAQDGTKKSIVRIHADEIEFAESKASAAQNTKSSPTEQPKEEPKVDSSGFMDIPDDDLDTELPFA